MTSSLYGANFGGTLGADADCTASANAQRLGGRWRAWLSDSMTPAPTRIYTAPGGYVLLDGTVVAGSLGALLSGALAHAIDRTERNEPISDGNTEVWTGIDVAGFMQNPGYCENTARASTAAGLSTRGEPYSRLGVNLGLRPPERLRPTARRCRDRSARVRTRSRTCKEVIPWLPSSVG